MSYTGDDIGGVGGWLAFFVIVMAVLTPLGLLGGTAAALYGDPQIAQVYGAAWGPLQAVTWISVAVGLAICWFITYRLMRVERWSTVRLTIAGIWALCAGLSVIEFAAVSLLAGIPIGELAAFGAVDLGRGLVFGVVWTLYFLMSKRVANTYRRDADGEELAERFA